MEEPVVAEHPPPAEAPGTIVAEENEEAEVVADQAEADEDIDLEDGEIEDDDEEDEEAAAPSSAAAPAPAAAASEDAESAASDADTDRKSRKSRRRDRDLQQELEDDEAKQRDLKEKLRRLEMQMMEEDEMAGIYTAGGHSPDTHKRRKRRSSSSHDDSGGSGRSRSRSPRDRRRGHKESKRRRGGANGENNEESRGGVGGGGFGGFGAKKSTELCKPFMMGKCPKTPLACSYSHEVEPPKVMELCKFYVLERCAKREKCLYLHKGFPCKFFHTGMPEWRCKDTAESCKFSHEPLTDVTRTILLKHLEAAPKEILGEFPRLTREQAVQLVYQTEAKLNGTLWNQKQVGPQRSAADNLIESANRQSQQFMQQMSGFPTGAGFQPQGGNGPQGGGQGGQPPQRKSRWGQGDPNNDPNAGGFNFPPPGMMGGPPGMGFGPRSQMPPRMALPPPGLVRPNPGPGLLGPRPPVMPPVGASGFPMRPPNVRPPVAAGGFGANGAENNFSGNNSQETNSFGDSSDNNFQEETPQSVAQDPWLAGLSQKAKSEKQQERETTPTPEENMDFGSQESEEDNAAKQKKAFEKLQEKQKERKKSLDAMKEVNPVFKEENWYSSDDEATPSASETTAKPKKEDKPAAAAAAVVASPAPTAEAKPKRDPRMNRKDPRQKDKPPAAGPPPQPPPTAADPVVPDVDLSMFEELDIPTFGGKDEEEDASHEEEGYGGLPFKPHKMPAMAKEIDASIHSHSPLEYRLRAIAVAKPDYSDMVLKQHVPASKIQADPRLRRYANLKRAEASMADIPFRSPPTAAAAPAQHSHKRMSQDEENVYNPMRDLQQAPRPQQHQHQQQRNDPYNQDVYSPSQEVQDMYQQQQQGGMYNPRQDQKGWGGPDRFNNYNQDQDGFYGNNESGDYYNNSQNNFNNGPGGFQQQQQQAGFGFNNSDPSFANRRGGGFGQGPVRGGNKDPRRRDPRQRN